VQGEYISLLPEKSADMRKEKKRVGSQLEGVMSKIEKSINKGIPALKEDVNERMPEIEESVSTEIKKIATGEAREYRGLCWMCKGASTCTYRRDPLQPVWLCDQFEYGTSPVSISTPTYSRVEFTSEHKNPPKYAGLCFNCENRETCTYPKPEGGVWRCEEYE